MSGHHITCPGCGATVGTYLVASPKVRAGKAIPAIRVPYRHKRPAEMVKRLGGPEWCSNGARSGDERD